MRKLSHVIISSIIVASVYFLGSPLYAYVGLCCGKCGGNMPLNILGAGIPETHEFRFKFTESYMSMNGLRSGTKDISSSGQRSLPTSIYQQQSSMSSMGSMGSMMNPMEMGSGSSAAMSGMSSMPAMGSDAAVAQDNFYGKASGAKYMATPQNMQMHMVNIAMGYSFTDRFFGGVMFMGHQKRMDMSFNYMMQGMTGQKAYTMKSEGMGDTMAITKFRLWADNPAIPTSQFSLVAGMSLPTGSINKKNINHPVGDQQVLLATSMGGMSTDRKNELLPYNMQLGSGTFDPLVGFSYQGSRSPFWWGVNVLYKGRWYRNRKDYAMGDEYTADVYVIYQLFYNFTMEFQLNGKSWGAVQGEMKEAKSGEVGRTTQNNQYSSYMSPAWDPANYGGDQVNATIGFQWQPKGLHVVELSFSTPVYQRLNGIQMKEEGRVNLAYYIEMPTAASIRHPKAGKKGGLGFE